MKRSDPRFDPNYWGNNRRERVASLYHQRVCNKIIREQETFLERVLGPICGLLHRIAYGKKEA